MGLEHSETTETPGGGGEKKSKRIFFSKIEPPQDPRGERERERECPPERRAKSFSGSVSYSD